MITAIEAKSLSDDAATEIELAKIEPLIISAAKNALIAIDLDWIVSTGTKNKLIGLGYDVRNRDVAGLHFRPNTISWCYAKEVK